MKSLLLLFLPLFFIECSKQNDPPIENHEDTTVMQNHPDTLTAGWTKINLPDSGYMIDIFFANNQLGYTNSADDIYKSVDGGLTWTTFAHNPGYLYNNLAVTPNGNLFVTAGDNTISKSVNGNPIKSQHVENIYGDADVFLQAMIPAI